MVGITSYGAYIPYCRLPRSVINAAWARGGGRGEKAVAGIDEDAITMAVAAGTDCLKGLEPKTVDALYLATTTAPYKERLNATIAATALDFRRDARNADFAHCLRAGTAALMSAVDAVKAGSLGSVLVAASDMRLGGASGEDEQAFGDGAAALLIGKDDVAAEVEATYTLSDDIVDYWRAHEDQFVRAWEDRFGLDEGYRKIPAEAAAALLEQSGLTAKDISKVCFYGPSTRRHAELGQTMGFSPQQIQDPMLDTVGNTGVAHSLMVLVGALEQAKPGDRVLLVNWGNGSDAILLRATDRIEQIKNKRAISGHLQVKRVLDNYGKYLRWRGMVALAPLSRPEGAPVSMSAEWRERRSALPLYGVRCKECGTVQLFMNAASTRAHVCLECQARDSFEPYRFADKKGKVVSFSHDYLGGGIDPPATRTVVNFDGGGRGLFDMSDRDPNECKVGMDVEMTFRKLRYLGGVHSYFWKCKPVRD